MNLQKFEIPQVRTLSGIVALLVLMMSAAIGLLAEKAPDPAGLNAPINVFSAARALTQLQVIAHEPHPTGTEANTKVRNYLIDELKALGLDPQIQSGLGANTTWGAVAQVNNVLVRIPGATRGKALLLAAHYDSVPTGPGAGDDGASVAAILETLRAMKSGPPLQNDLICLFTDAEEAGLLGSELFVREIPWVRDIGMGLNFEFRGNSGPMLMFETSKGNAKLIAGLASSVDLPIANSLSYEIYKLLPNDTDFTNFKKAGIRGMNFAAIDGANSYHTQLDRPDLLSLNTLQHEGNIMLALVRHFGNIPLNNLDDSDSVYFNAPGLGLIQYPVGWILPLCVIVTGLFLVIFVLAIKRKIIRYVRPLAGAILFVLFVGTTATLCQLSWSAATWIYPAFKLQYQPYHSPWYVIALAGFVIALFSGFQTWLKSWIKPTEFALGAMLCWVLLVIATSIFLPGASFVFLWPVVPVLLVNLLLLSGRVKPMSDETTMWIYLAGTIPAVILFTPLIDSLFVALGPNLLLATGLALALLLGLAGQVLALLSRPRLLPAISFGAGLIFLVIAVSAERFDRNQPRPTNLFYAVDGHTGKAIWLSRDTKLDSWTRQIFPTNAMRGAVPEIFGPQSKNQFWQSAAPASDIVAPTIETVSDVVAGEVRIVSVKIHSLRQAFRIHAAIEGAEIIQSRVQGLSFTTTPRPDWRLLAQGMPDHTVQIDFQVKPGQPFQLRAFDESYGLAQFGLPPRSDEYITEQSGTLSDAVIAVQVKNFD